MKRKQPLWLNIYLIFGILISFYALLKSYLDRKDLPPNVCPIENNNNIIFLGISLLVSYIIIAVAYDYLYKKRNNKEDDL
ncbi:hypothetical protein EDC19_2612 [Natranaerovirga hydrolytica]|uniref:Uncharacterized protein n=1 Tax=Natranaerovirga hydrolytica TaxID=680378 RepID=A0A4R1M7Q7_9FIRM|nr:hypothetical protein [Natranaerovirga hydrolytica]TCK87965.1 hypothetical protein EDC19_2612 [Natranaerovirga hydrolytica]